MGTGGLEPPRILLQRILSPSCLPISPHSHSDNSIVTETYLECNRIVFFQSRGQLKRFKHANRFHKLLFLFKFSHRKLETNEICKRFVPSITPKVKSHCTIDSWTFKIEQFGSMISDKPNIQNF